MRKLLMLAVCGLLLWAAAPSYADWDVGMPAKWIQMPDLDFTGLDVNASVVPDDYVLSDDFECTQTGPLTEIHIWGSWLHDILPVDDPSAVSFILSIHADIPADQNPDGYSMPGPELWSLDIPPGSFTVRPFAPDIEEGWFDPPENFIPPPADTICWQYNFRIDDATAFIQEGTAANPVIYWLSVKAIPVDQTALFGWKTSLDHWNDDGVYGYGPAPNPGPWRELVYPLGHPFEQQSIDLAFVLNGPEAPEEFDFGDAPDPLYPTYSASNGPYHLITGLVLGALIDGEPDGQPDANATGDDLNNLDDEDGVTLASPLVPGQPSGFTITTNGPGLVDAWVDWNRDGDWSDGGEQILTAYFVNGTVNAPVNVPNFIVGGHDTFARFRLSSNGGLNYDGVYPDGTVPDGEIEDYKVFIEPNPEYKWGQAPDLTPDGIDVNTSVIPRDYILADDFLCEGPGRITYITVFGSWLEDWLPFNDPLNVHFQLSIHADIPADQYPDGYSVPGEVLWLQDFPPGSFDAVIYEDGIREGWLDAPDAYQPPPADTICWQYIFRVNPDDAFFQQGTPENPIIYWLDVKAIPQDDSGPRFGWKTSLVHWNDDAVWGEGPDPYPGPWQELRYPQGHPQEPESIDLAFTLMSDPMPLDLDWGDAPDSYQTVRTSDGPRHYLSNLMLGTLIDPEPDGLPSPAALGDDMNNLADEDGVLGTGAVIPGNSTTVSVTASANGFLNTWFDWNGDGDFGEADEHVFIDLPLAAGTTSLSVAVPTTAVPGLTFSRYRFSSSVGLSWHGVLPGGQIPDGEIEDHQVVIEEETAWKWYQAPDLDITGIDVNASPYPRDYILADDFRCTERSAITEIHVFGSWLGDLLPNFEPQNVSFDLSFHSDLPANPPEPSQPLELLWQRHFPPGSFNVRPYVEGIAEGWLDPPDVYLPPPADTRCYEYVFTVPIEEAFVQEGQPGAPVVYWLDLKAYPEGTGQEIFGWKTSLDHWNDDAVWGVGIEPYPGPWNELIYPDGHWFEGQSIDLAFGLVGEPAPDLYDWGDAPDSYRTLFASLGPRHQIGPLFLGALIDGEHDGQPSAVADLDDNTGVDDEDGVVFASPLKPNQNTQIVVTASQAGMLDAWIDWNADGNFAGPGEQIFASQPVIAGVNNLTITCPTSMAANTTTFSRFRLSSLGGLGYAGDYPTGVIPDGEIEDHAVWLEDEYVYKWIQTPDLSPEGIDVNASALFEEDGFILADDFDCRITGPLTDFLVWGSWLQDRYPAQGPDQVTFTLSIHADIPADQSPTEYSMPGELLWMKTFRPGEFETVEFAPQIEEGWMDPPDLYVFPGDWTCWQYHFHVDPHLAFIQEGTPDDPVVYWLDVQARVEEPDIFFGWKTSNTHWNDDAVWGFGREPYGGSWRELRYPPGHELVGFSIDLAFAVFQDLVTPVPEVPEKVGLLYTAPNPFNPMTVIHFVMPEGGGEAKLEVFDAAGRRVATLVDGVLDGGHKQATWYGRSDAGRAQPSGVYFARLRLPDGTTETMKMMLLK